MYASTWQPTGQIIRANVIIEALWRQKTNTNKLIPEAENNVKDKASL